MKRILYALLMCAASAVPAFAQAPVSPVYFDARTIPANCVPKLQRMLGPDPVFQCANLADNGTQLLYNGQPLVSAQPSLNLQSGSSYTLAPSDCAVNGPGVLVTLTNTSGNIALTLPQPGASFPAGCRVQIRNASWSVPGTGQAGVGYAVTLTPTGSTIGGFTSVPMFPLLNCTFTSDGTNWSQPYCTSFTMLTAY